MQPRVRVLTVRPGPRVVAGNGESGLVRFLALSLPEAGVILGAGYVIELGFLACKLGARVLCYKVADFFGAGLRTSIARSRIVQPMTVGERGWRLDNSIS